MNEVKTENAKLKKDNVKLQQRVSLLQKQAGAAVIDTENLRRYTREATPWKFREFLWLVEKTLMPLS